MRFVGLSMIFVCLLALTFPAEADFWGGSINPVGKAIEKATQDTGKALEKAGQDTGKTIEKAGQDTGALVQKVMAARSTDSILNQLTKLPLDKLYALKVSPDICASGTVNCEVLANDRVRQFIDIEIDRRKAVLDTEDKNRTFLISLGSFVVSFCAFGLSVFGLFRNRGAAVGA